MGSIKQKRAVSLSLFFLKYFMYLCAGALLTAFCAVCIFNTLVFNQMVYAADYAQKEADRACGQIAAAGQVTKEDIPELCQYAVFDPDGTMREGSIGKRESGYAWSAVRGKSADRLGNYYKVAPVADGYCVLRFQIMPQFKSAKLRRYLPNPQNLILTAVLMILLSYTCFISVCFGRSLKKKLHPLISAAGKIQNRELEFSMMTSSIKEINTVLNAMEQMRIALKESLERQWKLEQSRKEQMASLAHDLKTPLTIIRGNTDLLHESELTEEQEEYCGYIQSSIQTMQDYVKALIDISQTESGAPIEIRCVDTRAFLEELYVTVEGLLTAKEIELRWDTGELPATLHIHQELLHRALLNVFSNAADFTPQGGTIAFYAAAKDRTAVFRVSDSGPGFSPKALTNAAKEFYMDDESRSSNLHYGMGLYIASMVAKRHGGELTLTNADYLKGAEVTIKIPESMVC